MAIYVAPRAKAMIGVGAASYQAGLPLLSAWSMTPQKLMAQAVGFWKSDPWIRTAERVISGRFASVDWHLEDENDTEIDDEYPNPLARAAWSLLEAPQALYPGRRQMTRRDLWSITSRHMGICGNAFWYLDRREAQGGTPDGILYIAPWRMSSAEDSGGNLVGWVMDRDPNTNSGGTPFELEEILHFVLEPADEGVFGVGLVQSALQLATLNRTTVSHITNTLLAGGRLAGIVSPKNESIPDDKFAQLVRDFRSIVEMPDAAKRMNILQSPVQFDRIAATPAELSLLGLMTQVRDDILAMWGLPLSQAGISVASGLNGGESKKYDEASLWQNAIHPRIVPFRETIQFQLLDRWKDLGIQLELEIEEPEFDDDGPRFELLAKSIALPMRNSERRALIGLDPFGDPTLDNAIYLPSTQVNAGYAPDENGQPVVPVASLSIDNATQTQDAQPTTGAAVVQPVPALAPGIAKAGPLGGLRDTLAAQQTPLIRTTVAQFLTAQRKDVAQRLRTNAEYVQTAPLKTARWFRDDKNTRVWFPRARWDRELTSVLTRHLTTVAQRVDLAVRRKLNVGAHKASPGGAVAAVLTKGVTRVTNINQRTEDALRSYIITAVEDGQLLDDIATAIEDGLADVLLDNGQPAFDELRAETIARTELMSAYNDAALGSYGEAGVTEVVAVDGDGDEECAARDGQTFSIEEANGIDDHPNGTLDWDPVIDEAPAKAMVDTSSVDALTAVIRSLSAAPVINIPPTVVNVPAPVVNVTVPETVIHIPAPVVNVPAQAAPIVDTSGFTTAVQEMRDALAKPVHKTVERDAAGNITGITEESR